MITRHFDCGDTRSAATYSACNAYRYSLSRDWSGGGRRLLYILLNPSTATEEKNDPTIERCERRARRSGFDGFAVVNLFAFRATDPQALRQVADPVGPGNDAAIARAAADAALILCGWGIHGAFAARDKAVCNLLARSGRPLWHLGQTRAGQPRHPLYVGYATEPQPWVATRLPKNTDNCA
ncbi:MAG: DUF1643 domain-containing protein [Rhodobacteraceae bacterium]|nr:DUF1643 domain-containing protein [Paracoccaceae bacterium]